MQAVEEEVTSVDEQETQGAPELSIEAAINGIRDQLAAIKATFGGE